MIYICLPYFLKNKIINIEISYMLVHHYLFIYLFIFFDNNKDHGKPGPLYNTVRYNTVLDI